MTPPLQHRDIVGPLDLNGQRELPGANHDIGLVVFLPAQKLGLYRTVEPLTQQAGDLLGRDGLDV